LVGNSVLVGAKVGNPSVGTNVGNGDGRSWTTVGLNVCAVPLPAVGCGDGRPPAVGGGDVTAKNVGGGVGIPAVEGGDVRPNVGRSVGVRGGLPTVGDNVLTLF